MNKNVLVLAALGAVVAIVACVPSPPELCQRGVDLACDRTHECTPAEQKDAGLFQAVFGTSPADCKTKLAALQKCTEKQTQDDLCTQVLPDGGTRTGKYDLGKAAECSDAVKAQSCADYLSADKVPAACTARCTY